MKSRSGTGKTGNRKRNLARNVCASNAAWNGSWLMFRYESHMRVPVCQWAERRGFACCIEFWCHGCGICDIVGARFSCRGNRRQRPQMLATIAIELKLESFAAVLKQAERNAFSVTESWLAMPDCRIDRLKPASLARAAQAGVGVLSVCEDGECVPVLEPTHLPGGLGSMREKTIWKRIRSRYGADPASHANQ